MAHAEAPALGVVGGAVGDAVGLVGQAEDVAAELGERHAAADGGAVVQDVQVAVGEVEDHAAVRVLDPGLAHRPFPRHGPVEHRRPGRHLAAAKADLAVDDVEGVADAGTGQAAADRVELRGERVDLRAEIGALRRRVPARGGRRHHHAVTVVVAIGCIEASCRLDRPGRRRCHARRLFPRITGGGKYLYAPMLNPFDGAASPFAGPRAPMVRGAGTPAGSRARGLAACRRLGCM